MYSLSFVLVFFLHFADNGLDTPPFVNLCIFFYPTLKFSSTFSLTSLLFSSKAFPEHLNQITHKWALYCQLLRRQIIVKATCCI